MRSNAKRNETSEVDASAAQVQAEDASANRAPSGEEIRLRAFEIYLERNGLPGDELDDWLERNANSKRSLSSHETGIAFTTRIPPLRAPERAFRTQKTERGRAMTILEILGSLIGAALVVAAVAYIRRSRKSREPIQLTIDKKFRR